MSASAFLYRLRPRAVLDMEDIWRYTAQRWSVGQASSYTRSIIDAFAGLAAGDKKGRPSDIRDGYHKYAVGSHVIYFTLAEGGIDVVRVLHGRMDVERHLKE